MAATTVWITEKSTINKNHTDHTFLLGADANADVGDARLKMNCTHSFVLSNPFNARSPNDDRWLHVILFKYYLYIPLYEISIILFAAHHLSVCGCVCACVYVWERVVFMLFPINSIISMVMCVCMHSILVVLLKQTNRANQPISRLTFDAEIQLNKITIVFENTVYNYRK